MARRRTLQPEEEELWRTVARTARPLHEHPIFHKPEPVATTAPMAHAKPRLNPFTLGERVRRGEQHDMAPSLPSLLAAAPLQMDAKTHGKMTRGKLAPEARIDLHGMTLAEAHPELIRPVAVDEARRPDPILGKKPLQRGQSTRHFFRTAPSRTREGELNRARAGGFGAKRE